MGVIVIEVDGPVKRYREKTAVNGLTFRHGPALLARCPRVATFRPTV
jgi:hypothetical protein